MIETNIPNIQAFTQILHSPDCGPVAVKSIYASIRGEVLSDDSLKVRLGTTSEGTRPENIKRFFTEEGFVVSEGENQTIEDIKRELLKGRLCLVAYQAWGTEKEYQEMESGHYSVIYGVDDEDVYLLDSSIYKDVGLGIARRKLSLERFMENWKDKDDAGRIYTRWYLAVGEK